MMKKLDKPIKNDETCNVSSFLFQINSYPLSIPIADKLILAFPDREELDNIDCQIPFIYTTYPELEVINE